MRGRGGRGGEAMRGPWPPRRGDFPEIDGAALGKANWVIMIAQTRARPQFAAIVLGRQVTSEDVETVTWVYAENAREFLRATLPRRST
jgi:hypothetical protein